GPACWYYILKGRHFIAYDRTNNQISGYMGPNGFAPGNRASQAGTFTVDTDKIPEQFYQKYFVCNDAVYLLQLERQKIEISYQKPDDQKLLGYSLLPDADGVMYSDKKAAYAIATDKFVQTYDQDNHLIWTFPQPENLKAYSSMQVLRTSDLSRYFLFYRPTQRTKSEITSLVVELSATGEILKQTVLPGKWQNPVYNINGELLRQTMLEPFGRTLWGQILYPVHCYLFKQKYTPLWKTSAEYRNHTLKLWGIEIATGMLCALLAQWWLKRQKSSSRERIGWSIFIIAYGFAGLIVFFILQDWPRRIKCYACGKKRSVEQLTCEHCNAAWPSSPEDGTEIFEEEVREISIR
ncbi:MAG: hypothetical protein ABIP97_12270, partial [Chthoniobacterales bacterium]